ncbi:hypothetical protein [Paraburkholderia sp.]|uniref:hypothetical protein n=1 Tax=Paraburkholderia sp. TaxID=1926495 RepID=UPI0025F87ACF|nr:hypothetical protein [Paraburkholderia sp.]
MHQLDGRVDAHDDYGRRLTIRGFDGMEEAMNWLEEYFSHRTPVLNVSIWAYPPLLIGPDGPVAQKPYCLPYPGAELVFRPGEDARHGMRSYEVPARYDMRDANPFRNLETAQDFDNQEFFRSIEIFAPSLYNCDFLIRVNGTFAFVPIFSADGDPGFFGSCIEQPVEPSSSHSRRLPWCFRGYVSI